MGTSTLQHVQESDAYLPVASRRQHRSRVPRVIVASLGIVSILVGTVAGVSIGAFRDDRAHATPGQARQAPPAVLPVTAPDARWSAFASARQTTSPLFQAYYTAHTGSSLLGPALTPAIPVQGGWIQLFTSGALFAPREVHMPRRLRLDTISDETLTPTSTGRLIRTGFPDNVTNVVRLPLLQALMAAGSEISIGGPIASLTYVDLRRAAQPDRLIPAPAWYSAASPTGDTGTFIPEGRHNGKLVGHLIPPALWNALAQRSLAPDGWQVDLGKPLTEALPDLVTRGGQEQGLTVQLFERGGLIVDAAGSADQPNAAPTVQPLSVGLDYLRTFGPPDVTIATDTPIWVNSDAPVAVYAAADPASAPLAHLRRNFALTLTTESMWVGTTLWYRASWRTPHREVSGWIPASNISFAPVSNEPASANFDVLDPDLAGYLANFGSRVGAVVYDVSRQTYYEYNEQTPFIVASSIKVPIMLALLTQLEAQGREPNDGEMALLTTMIEESNNDAAQQLYEEIGDAPGLSAFMQQVNVQGIEPSQGTWGWSTTTPMAMVRLLTLLQAGKLLTAPDRALALNLMRHIEDDQQTGVGTTAPDGAEVEMKDGWVPGPDGLWVVNTSGIVTLGHETYIISVYTQDDNSLEQGWDITQHVSRAVAQLLT